MSPKPTLVHRDPFAITLDIISGKLPGVDVSALLQKYPMPFLDLVSEGTKEGGFTADMVERHVGSIFSDGGPEGGMLGNINLLSFLQYITVKNNLRPFGASAEADNTAATTAAPVSVKVRRQYRKRKTATATPRTPRKAKAGSPVSDQVRAFIGNEANTKRLLEKAGGMNKLAQLARDSGIDVKDANFYWVVTHQYPQLFGKRSGGRKKRNA